MIISSGFTTIAIFSTEDDGLLPEHEIEIVRLPDGV